MAGFLLIKENIMNITQYRANKDNYTVSNRTEIKYLVIHYVGATGGAEANCKYYAENTPKASAHYYVGFNGEVYQSVEDKDIAWHCGTKGTYRHPECRNQNSIGIEMCVRNNGSKADTSKDWYFEDATVKSAIELAKMIMAKYNIPIDRVIRHHDVTGKICPNPYVYNHTKHTWEAFKNALVSKKSGWVSEDGGWKFYLGNTGECVRNEWYCYGGSWAWFDGAGAALCNKWLQYEKHWYWFGSDCYMVTNSWVYYDNDWYYIKSDGTMATNMYIKSKEPKSNVVYYVDSDGKYDPTKDSTTYLQQASE